jgi:site-specific DNA-methyltransferase (adenine-specific)
MESKAYNSDSLKAMRLMAENAYDLALPDVPYGIDEGNKVLSRVRPVLQRNGRRTPMMAIHRKKDWDKEQPTQEYFDQLFRVSRYQIIFGENYLLFTQKSTSSGRIFWDKVNGGSDFSDGEMLWTNLISSVRQFTYMWNGFCQAISTDQPTKQRGNKKLNEKRIHPSQKPIAIYGWLLKTFARPGWKILDTHLGSGSSRIAAWDLGFDFTGYELDKEYFEAQEERFQRHIAQPKLFEAPQQIVSQSELFL